MQKKLLKISLGILGLSLFVSCTTVEKLIPPKERPFQKRNLDSKLWINGDAQTRGEMSEDLRSKRTESKDFFLDSQTREEILAILGEPDRKTRGKCCGAGGTYDEEVWLYNIKVEKTGTSELKTEHFQFYFNPNGKVDETRIALWDDKAPNFFPRIG